MNTRELVGSVLMFGFRGSSFDDPETREDIEELKSIHCKGVILFDHDTKGNHARNIRSPKQVTKLIEDLRNELGDDLIVSIDQEGWAVSRLNENNGFRPTMSAKAFAQSLEIDQIQYAQQQANQLAKLGIDLNFAPCVDLEIELGSPIISGKERSFGDDLERVRKCASIVIDAHLQSGVVSCIKHFPGHGSSLLDSHNGVCEITNTHQSIELEIYRTLIDQYQSSIAIMHGHLIEKNIDPEYPASLSKPHIDRVRTGFGFDGVIITDSLDMRAIRNMFGEDESALLALSAGADLILDGVNAPGYRALKAPTRIATSIVQAIAQNHPIVNEQRLHESKNRLRTLIDRTRESNR